MKFAYKWLLGVVLFMAMALGAACIKIWLDFREYELVPIDIKHARIDRGSIEWRYSTNYEDVDVKYEYEFGGVRYTSRIFECKWYGQYLIISSRPTYQSRVKNLEYVTLLNSGARFSAWVSVNNPGHACIFRDGRFALIGNGEEVD